jgi:hypothetical protein
VTIETVVGTTDYLDIASENPRLVVADRAALVGVAKAHELAKLVHGGRHYAAVAFLEKGSPVTSVSKGGPGCLATFPKHGSVGHAEHDKVVRRILRIEAPRSNVQLLFRCSYNLSLAITKDIARGNVNRSINVYDSALHSSTRRRGLDVLCAE